MKKVLIGLVALFIAFCIFIALKPGEFKIERSTTIEAPAQVVFAHVNEIKKWEDWSPWAKLDPNVKSIYEGPASGVGSAMYWSGNKDVGEGKMTIVESVPASQVKLQLDFKRPMEGTNMAELAFKPEGNKTTVTWSMTGKNGFVGKLFCLIMNGEKMVGDDFEKGLASLKAVSETKK